MTPLNKRLAALCLLLAAATVPASLTVAVSPSRPDDPIQFHDLERQSASSTSATSSSSKPSSLSATSSSSLSAASATSPSSSSSYITLNLPDSFVQCEPALVGFTSVVSARDEDLLGGSMHKVKQNTWINVRIRNRQTRKTHLTQDLEGDATTWSWPAVDLPAGTRFDISVASLTNISTEVNPSTGVLFYTSRQKTYTRILTARERKAKLPASRHKKEIQVVAQNIASSTVVSGASNITNCLPAIDSSIQTTDPAWSNQDGDAGLDSSPTTNRTVILVAAVLGGLCGLFIALVAALCWHKRRDQKRLRVLAEISGRGYDHDIAMARRSQLHAEDISPGAASAPGHSRTRSSVVPLWDGGYRDGPSAGWGYMSSLAPGLAPQAPPPFSLPTSPLEGAFAAIRRRRRRPQNLNPPVNRRREQGEEDLPTYICSEQETKALPGYEHECGPFDFPPRVDHAGLEHGQTSEDQPFYYEDADMPRGESQSLLGAVPEESEGSHDSYIARRIQEEGAPGSFRAPPPAEVGRSVTMNIVDRRSYASSSVGGHNSDASGSVVFNGPSPARQTP